MAEKITDSRMSEEDAARWTRKSGLGVTWVKVERRCPRCHACRLHCANRRKGKSRTVVTITCAECGHDWKGRYVRDEWDGDL